MQCLSAVPSFAWSSRRRNLLISTFLGLMAGCKTAATSGVKNATDQPAAAAIPDATKLDIIDTGFLLPFPEKGGFSIKASGDSVSDGGIDTTSVIMSKDEFKRLPPAFFAHMGKGETAETMLDRLYITGFRYDPCFPIVTPDLSPNGPGCRLRAIRLVGQFIDFDRHEASAASMHILFVTKHPDPAMELAINNAIIQGLKDLKKVAGIDTAGAPLGIHPGFSGKNTEEFSRKVKALILKFAGQRNFFATSVFFKSPEVNKEGETTWNWAQFLRKDPDLDNPAIKHLGLEVTTGVKPGVSLDFGKLILSADGQARLAPGKGELRDVQDPNVKLFFPIPDLSPLLIKSAPVPALVGGVMAADVFENPKMMTIPAGDCAGCHTTTQRKLNALSTDGVPFNRQFEFKPAPGITGQMDPSILTTMGTKADDNADHTIVFNFGYHGKDPVVSQRTVNEAAQVTLLINEKMLDGNWGPTPTPTPVPGPASMPAN